MVLFFSPFSFQCLLLPPQGECGEVFNVVSGWPYQHYVNLRVKIQQQALMLPQGLENPGQLVLILWLQLLRLRNIWISWLNTIKWSEKLIRNIYHSFVMIVSLFFCDILIRSHFIDAISILSLNWRKSFIAYPHLPASLILCYRNTGHAPSIFRVTCPDVYLINPHCATSGASRAAVARAPPLPYWHSPPPVRSHQVWGVISASVPLPPPGTHCRPLWVLLCNPPGAPTPLLTRLVAPPLPPPEHGIGDLSGRPVMGLRRGGLVGEC